VAEAGHCCRCDVDWKGDGRAEHGCRGGAGGAVHEDARAEEDAGVDGGVEVFGVEIIGGRVIVCEAFSGDEVAGCGLEFADVEDIFEWWNSVGFRFWCG